MGTRKEQWWMAGWIDLWMAGWVNGWKFWCSRGVKFSWKKKKIPGPITLMFFILHLSLLWSLCSSVGGFTNLYSFLMPLLPSFAIFRLIKMLCTVRTPAIPTLKMVRCAAFSNITKCGVYTAVYRCHIVTKNISVVTITTFSHCKIFSHWSGTWWHYSTQTWQLCVI